MNGGGVCGGGWGVGGNEGVKMRDRECLQQGE